MIPHFGFQAAAVSFPSEYTKFLPDLTCEGVFECVENFPPSYFPPWSAGLCPENFYLFFYLYLFSYLILAFLKV